ncbi:MAG: hypothetical protein NUW07_09800 [Candidatus Saccharicenans sp.]|nr:hypothetical protein [Candidatus Saccharicenans sp.]
MSAKKRGLWARLFNSRLEEEEKKAIIQDVSQYESQLIETAACHWKKSFRDYRVHQKA